MSSRDTILGTIRTALGDTPSPDRPPAPHVWPDTNPSVQQMTDRFAEELEAVTGELHRCASMNEAKAKLAELLAELGCKSIGSHDRPELRELTASVQLDRIDWGETDELATVKAELDASLVSADYLLADTGTAMVTCGTPHERLMCYLPPVCIVLGTTAQLVEHMPAAWRQVAPRVADPELRGEFVFITGPSRTADIEKILILGVHGPKRLLVLLVG